MPSRRPRFYFGQLLTAEDLEALLEHVDRKSRLHNRGLHGAGVVSGLRVALHGGPHGGPAPTVTVGAGTAIDPTGRLVELEQPAVVPLPAPDATGVVVLVVEERLVDPVPTTHGTEYRSVESVTVARWATRPAPDQLAVAHVVRGRLHPAPTPRPPVRLSAAEPTGLRPRPNRRFS